MLADIPTISKAKIVRSRQTNQQKKISRLPHELSIGTLHNKKCDISGAVSLCTLDIRLEMRQNNTDTQ